MTNDKPPACQCSDGVLVERAACCFADIRAMFAAIHTCPDIVTAQRLANIGGTLAYEFETEFGS